MSWGIPDLEGLVLIVQNPAEQVEAIVISPTLQGALDVFRFNYTDEGDLPYLTLLKGGLEDDG